MQVAKQTKEKCHSDKLSWICIRGFGRQNGISAGISDLIQRFIQEKPAIGAYDILIIDEYQDIEQELAVTLTVVKGS